MNGELSITIDGQKFTGWTATRFSRSCEQFPSSFEISATEKDPTGTHPMVFVPFSPCTIAIDDDLVLTGYIDSIDNTIDAASHTITIAGRSKGADLVDCSAEIINSADGIPGFLYGGADLMGLATALCLPYGITVSLNSKQELTDIPLFQMNIGDSPYEIIERMARSQNLLVYDDVNGNLVLADVGAAEHQSGFDYGANIQSITSGLHFDHRYSEIDVFDSSVQDQLTYITNRQYGHAEDTSIRHRRLMGFSETPYVLEVTWAQRRANWEMARSRGRSQVIHLQCESWRDSHEILWQPNNYVAIRAAPLQIDAKWIIANVSYSMDLNGGTYADLILMPPEAFNPEPTSLLFLDAGLFAGVNNSGSASSDGGTPSAGANPTTKGRPVGGIS
jgi:prophage tail gpP-like protein